MSAAAFSRSFWNILLTGFLWLLFALLALSALASPMLVRVMTPSIQVGQVAAEDYQAPRSITYTSEVLTNQKREAAERAVQPVYTPPDTAIARQQMERLRAALTFITSVRADSYATNKQKLDDLAALQDIHLAPETASQILALSDMRWQAVYQESLAVLEQAMRSRIRPDRLEDSRSNIPNLVSLALPEAQAAIVVELVSAFIAPNSFQNDALTEAARKEARDAVAPSARTFVAGETIVSRGQVITEADLEALQQLGLTHPKFRWQDLLSQATLVLLMVALLLIYLLREPAVQRETSNLIMIGALLLVFLFAARLVNSGDGILPYAFPVASFGLIVASLLNSPSARVFSLPLAILAAYGLPNTLELTIYYAMTSLFGVLALGRARRMIAFFRGGTAIALSGALVILAYRLMLPNPDWPAMFMLLGTSLFNGLAAASLAILLELFIAQFFGVATPMQLMDLTRPDHPLLRFLLRNAPGTYQHSLQLANLAEQAAERIGADPLLTRVGALYHDAGKAVNPAFFIENQLPGMINPHDDLDPATSAATIIRHVQDGLELARKYRLPSRVQDFISQHHGTMITSYQYVRSVEAAGGDKRKVDMEKFRYPGPRPQSRETAILMIADGCEARVRAELPPGEEELRRLIRGVIDDRLNLGQFDDTELTLKDLDLILDSFAATLKGIYHPRVKYPTLDEGGGKDDEALVEGATQVEVRTRPRPSPEPAMMEPVDHPSLTTKSL